MEKVIIFSIFGFLFSLIGTKYLKEYLERKKVFDIPNERSSHTKPMPKGGGWIIVIFLLIILLPPIYASGGWPSESYWSDNLIHIHLPITILGLAILSWLDDIKNINPFIRLFFQFFIIFYLLAAVKLTNDAITYLDVLMSSLVIVWFINIFNFMDGIDGITPSVAITIFAGYLIANTDITSFDIYSIIFCCLGLLFWNWHPAKIFLGDVGSVILGFICILFLITLAYDGQWGWAISLPMYYILDTSITLINRFIDGKKIREGACWTYIRFWFPEILYGRYPLGEAWRINLGFGLLLVAVVPLFFPKYKWKKWNGLKQSWREMCNNQNENEN